MYRISARRVALSFHSLRSRVLCSNAGFKLPGENHDQELEDKHGSHHNLPVHDVAIVGRGMVDMAPACSLDMDAWKYVEDHQHAYFAKMQVRDYTGLGCTRYNARDINKEVFGRAVENKVLHKSLLPCPQAYSLYFRRPFSTGNASSSPPLPLAPKSVLVKHHYIGRAEMTEWIKNNHHRPIICFDVGRECLGVVVSEDNNNSIRALTNLRRRSRRTRDGKLIKENKREMKVINETISDVLCHVSAHNGILIILGFPSARPRKDKKLVRQDSCEKVDEFMSELDKVAVIFQSHPRLYGYGNEHSTTDDADDLILEAEKELGEIKVDTKLAGDTIAAFLVLMEALVDSGKSEEQFDKLKFVKEVVKTLPLTS